MNLVIALLAFATAINGLLAGLSVDNTLAILPMHRLPFAVAPTPFTRGKAWGNGSIVSPLLQIRAALLTALASVLTSAERSCLRRLLLISCCSRESVWCVIICQGQKEEVP